MNRRSVLRRALGGALGVAGLASVFTVAERIGTSAPRAVPGDRGERGLLRPPGAVPERELLARCIRCECCAQACARGAIRLFGSGTGRLEGTPYVLAQERACDLCLECGKACPAGAIEVLADKSHARMGTAVVDPRLCVSLNGTGICGACYTVCPLRGKAIRRGIRNQPAVVADSCAGCGLCEEACIVRENRAIRVVSGRSCA